MTVTHLVFVTKKVGLPFDDFVAYLENEHVPLMQRLLGDAVPSTFRRNYVDSSNSPFIGPSRDIDLVMEMTWETDTGRKRFLAKLAEGDNARLLQESWPNYCDEKGETVVGAGRAHGH